MEGSEEGARPPFIPGFSAGDGTSFTAGVGEAGGEVEIERRRERERESTWLQSLSGLHVYENAPGCCVLFEVCSEATRRSFGCWCNCGAADQRGGGGQ